MLPIVARWTGEELTPIGRSRADCDAELVIGQIYRLERIEDRSQASHAHQFAWLAEAWRNLPDDLVDDYPTPEHLRKRALIQAGYFDETIIDVGNRAGALRVATALRGIDDFAYVAVRGSIVVRRVAKSQARGKMDKRAFQESKTAIMEIIAGLIGVTPEALQQNAGRAA